MLIDGLNVLADIPRHWARRRPDRTCTIFGDRAVSWAEFDRCCSCVASGLVAEGVGPQGRIGYLGRNSDLYFQLLFGAAKANVVMVAVNSRLAAPEVEYVLSDAGVEVLFVEPDFLPLARQAASRAGGGPRLMVAMGEADGLETYESWRDRQADADPMVPSAPDDVCAQLYTSGTTGLPKGVQIMHLGLIAQRAAYLASGDWAQWRDDDVSMVPMPVFHVGGTGWGFQAFYHGATQVILSQADPGAIIDAIQRHRVTNVFVVPAVLRTMLEHPAAKGADFSHVRVVHYGASPIPEAVLEKALATFDCPFVQRYGMTESSGTVTYLPPEDHVPGSPRLRSCGLPFPGAEIVIGGADDRPLPPGEVGEILIRAPWLMKGYWRRPDATAEATRGGWYHSGDAGYRDQDGYIYLHDRVKDMIVSGGENIYPAEVES
ncbi:MAG: AMP-binding protein, partial [Alphaproteobacteria bacterium]|nr:AMP-binding protein [Alphaproteobacteria bacterium]